MSGTYYNEIETYACDWLSNLMDAGIIPRGKIDDRSIADVAPDDLDGYDEQHFFAGLGGWAYALGLAGWPDGRPVVTGSCPCQPFSVAGKQQGFDDQRHLWPQFRRLIAERHPATVFGEQVAGASDWLGLVRSDLEALGYAVGCMPIEAASADAEHFRDRYWFVADRDIKLACEGGLQRSREFSGPSCPAQLGDGRISDAADGNWRRGVRVSQEGIGPHEIRRRRSRVGGSVALANGDGERSQIQERQSSDIGEERQTTARSRLRAVVNPPGVGWGEGWTESEFRSRGFTAAVASLHGRQYIECHDGKWRRLPPPRVRWLGNGIPARISKLRALGNAIDPRPATAFIRSFLDAERDLT